MFWKSIFNVLCYIVRGGKVLILFLENERRKFANYKSQLGNSNVVGVTFVNKRCIQRTRVIIKGVFTTFVIFERNMGH